MSDYYHSQPASNQGIYPGWVTCPSVIPSSLEES